MSKHRGISVPRVREVWAMAKDWHPSIMFTTLSIIFWGFVLVILCSCLYFAFAGLYRLALIIYPSATLSALAPGL